MLAVTGILKQQKRTKNKTEFDPYELTGSQRPTDPNITEPGDHRADVECLLYRRDALPQSEEEWNAFTFVEKTHWGYYTWPRWDYHAVPGLLQEWNTFTFVEKTHWGYYSWPRWDKLSLLSLQGRLSKYWPLLHLAQVRLSCCTWAITRMECIYICWEDSLGLLHLAKVRQTQPSIPPG